MSELLINDIKSNNKELNDCVCLKCYKLKCNARSIENKVCPKGEGK